MRICIVTAAALLVLSAGATGARTVTVDVTRADVQSYRPHDASLGMVYAMNLAVPARLPEETLMSAWLDVTVDAASGDSLAGAGLVTFEVFPLKSALSAELKSSDLRPAAMKRTVRVGASRRVRIDITGYVREVLEDPTKNFGLALGSLTGQRLGKFVLREGVMAPCVVARVTTTFLRLGGPRAERR